MTTELERELRRQRHLMRTATEGYVVLDAHGKVVDKGEPFAGAWPFDEVVGTAGDEWVHPDDRAHLMGELLSVFTGKAASMRTTARAVDSSGGVYWLDLFATNLMDDPDVGGVVLRFRDVTAQHRAEAALRLHDQLLDAVGQAVIATSPNGRIIYWNRAAEELYGWPAEEVLGRSIVGRVYAEDQAARADEIMAGLARGDAWSGDFEVQRRDGTTLLAFVTNTPLFDTAGDLVAIVGVAHDVTEQRWAARELAETAEALAIAQRIAHLGTFFFDVATERETWSGELHRIVGLDPAEPGSRRLGDWVHPEDWPTVDAAFQRTLLQGEVIDELVFRVVRPDGEVRWVLGSAERRTTGSGRDVVAGAGLDVTERVLAERERERLVRQLEHHELHDALTSLANRTLLTDRLGQALHRAARHGGRVVVLFVDLDQFKLVNESLGHQQGDRLLEEVARRLVRQTLAEDTVSRFGGDSFAIVREGVTTGEVLELADSVRRAFVDPFHLDDREVAISASVGVAVDDGSGTVGTVLSNADAAVHRAKERGRGRIEMFDESLRARAEARLEGERRLRQAIARRELTVHYQPVVRLADGVPVGVEALVRWETPEGLVPPSEFVPLAEETGLVVELGELVLDEATRQLAAWRAEIPGAGDLWVSVNLSGRQVGAAAVESVARALRSSGLAPDGLHLELTETAVMDDVAASVEMLTTLTHLGVGVAIDDFGTGYSSLSYLKRFPVAALKIDRQFVDGLGTDPNDSSIVGAVVALGEALGLAVLAEGVETVQQRDALLGLGCELGQGYLWSTPLPAAQASGWLFDILARRAG